MNHKDFANFYLTLLISLISNMNIVHKCGYLILMVQLSTLVGSDQKAVAYSFASQNKLNLQYNKVIFRKEDW